MIMPEDITEPVDYSKIYSASGLPIKTPMKGYYTGLILGFVVGLIVSVAFVVIAISVLA